MRILFITDKFGPERGGSQMIFGHLYRRLPEHRVVVLTRSAPGDAEFDAAYPQPVLRVPYSRIPKVRSPLLWWRLYRAGRRLLQAERFDQVHIGQPVETGPLGIRLAREFGLPALVHTFAEDITGHLDHPAYFRPMRGALRSAAAVTTISRFTRQHLVDLGVAPERIVLQYPGVRAEEWQPHAGAAAVRSEWGLEGKRVLLSVSRLIPRKGQDMALRALPAILEEVPETVLMIVGGGPEEARLRALAEGLGVSERVRFVGSMPNSRLPEFYGAADVFVMPNRQLANGDVEGFGLVFLEANACGLPVIGGNTGGTPDAIAHGESGYLVDPTSAGEIARRSVELLRDPALARRMGEFGRRRVLEEFTWEKSVAALRRAIEIAGGAPSRVPVLGAP